MERRATLYFKRSGQLPLTVSVELIKYGHFRITIWRMLLSCSNRWKWVRLDAHMTDLALKDFLGCRGKFSTLEYLGKKFCGRPYNAFEIAPRPNKLRLRESRHSRGCVGRWKFHWAQLTTLISVIQKASLASYGTLQGSMNASASSYLNCTCCDSGKC